MADSAAPSAPRPRLGVIKLASCDGCQLTLLSLEDELLALASAVDIVHFPEASSRVAPEGPFDVLLIEGSVSTQEQRAFVAELRTQARTVVALGACATTGGLQALRNWADAGAFAGVVYADASILDSLPTATPLSEHIRVDVELHGCPVSKPQLLELLTALLTGRRPELEDESVCVECKRHGTVCVLVARGEPCLGAVTRAGCGALCPRYLRACFGCFGPREQPNVTSLAGVLERGGASTARLVTSLRKMTGWAPAFRTASDALAAAPSSGAAREQEKGGSR